MRTLSSNITINIQIYIDFIDLKNSYELPFELFSLGEVWSLKFYL